MSEIIGNGIFVGGGGGECSQNILGGLANPTVNIGSDGDIYIKYTDYGNVPIGYTLLMYVQFVSGAYIDTGIIPSNHFTEMSVNDMIYGNDKHWLGTSEGTPYYHFTTYSNTYYWGMNGSETHNGTWSAGKHILEYNKNSDYKVIIDGVVLGNNSQITASQPMCIGYRNGYANADNFQVYYCKITDKNFGNQILDGNYRILLIFLFPIY